MAARTADDAQLDESLGSVLIRRRVKQRTASLIMNVVSIVYNHGPTGAATLFAELVAGSQSYRA